jgi:hypothetical protein
MVGALWDTTVEEADDVMQQSRALPEESDVATRDTTVLTVPSAMLLLLLKLKMDDCCCKVVQQS